MVEYSIWIIIIQNLCHGPKHAIIVHNIAKQISFDQRLLRVSIAKWDIEL